MQVELEPWQYFQVECKLGIAEVILAVSAFDEGLILTLKKIETLKKSHSSPEQPIPYTSGQEMISKNITENLNTLFRLLKPWTGSSSILPELHQATQNLPHALTIRNFISHNRAGFEFHNDHGTLLLVGASAAPHRIDQDRKSFQFYSSPQELEAIAEYINHLVYLIQEVPTMLLFVGAKTFEGEFSGSKIMNSHWPNGFREKPYPWVETLWPDINTAQKWSTKDA